MVPQVTWFRHSHENRNDLLRFGLMRLHYRGEIRYVELPFDDIERFGFSKAVTGQKDPRHLSFLLVQTGTNKLRCLVDNEDSFALVTPLIAEVDVCFCAGFNSDFFEKKQFVHAYSWQDEIDIRGYKKLMEEKLEKLGTHFGKIKKFIPIGPNQGSSVPVAAWKQKLRNVESRLNKIVGKGNDFSEIYKGFELREGYIKELRNADLHYDIVLNDSLWGWPQHRINLHKKLQDLHSRKYDIHSILSWTPPVGIDGSMEKRVDAAGFPIITSPIYDSYETMLSKSRLAVFACGFHWGWRNIMMLALQIGIPVLTDRLLTEPYFNMNEFKIFQQEDDLWSSVEPTLISIDHRQWKGYKKHNQAVYDKYMSPEAVAGYFLNSLEVTQHHHEYNEAATSQWKASA